MAEEENWEEYLEDLSSDGSDLAKFELGEDEIYFSDDGELFSLDDVTHTEVRDIRNHWSTQEQIHRPSIPTEIATRNRIDTRENEDVEGESEEEKCEIPKGMSIAHNYLTQEKLVYISFDIETGGEYCGIVQISAQVFRISEHNSKHTSEIESHTFNRYVKPPDDAVWNERSCSVHGLSNRPWV